MAFRYTQRDVQVHFERFVTAIGKRLAKSYKDVGGLRLDANPTYGGYVIEEIGNENGGVFHPFGDTRMKAESLIHAMRFALDTMRLSGRGGRADYRRRA